MDDINRSIGNIRANRYAVTELHVIDGRTSLFPAIPEQEIGADSQDAVDSGERRSRVRRAQRSAFSSNSFPAMVSCAAQDDVEGLPDGPNGSRIRLDQMNAPELLFSPREYFNLRRSIQHLREIRRRARAINFDNGRGRTAPSEFLDYEGQSKDDHVLPDFSFNHIVHGQDFVERGRSVNPIIDRTPLGGPSRPRASSVPAYQRHQLVPDDFDGTEAEFRKHELKQFLDIGNQHLQEHARTREGGKLYAPTTRDILREVWLARLTHHYFSVHGVDAQDLPHFRRYLRYHLRWDISPSRLKRTLLRHVHVVSAGRIPVSEHEIGQSEDHMNDLGLNPELPEFWSKDDDLRPTRPARENEAARAAREKMKRIYKQSPSNFHTDYRAHVDEDFEQKDDTSIILTLLKDPKTRSEIDLKYTFNYKDTSKPTVQPCEVAHVKLTYANARHHGDVITEDKEDTYFEVHRVIDVTSRIWDAQLKALFPHATIQDPAYFTKLRNSVAGLSNSLFLIIMPHNEHPFCVNLFTHRQVPNTTYGNLATIMKKSPQVFMLVRGIDIGRLVSNITDEFARLATFNPLTDFYVDPKQRYMNSKSIKSTPELPKFVTPAQYAFETYEEFEQHVGFSTVIEQRASSGAYEYKGTAAAVPVPGSFKVDRSIHMVYSLSVSLEPQSLRQPRLTDGDHVTINFSKDENVTLVSWKGNVTSSNLASGLGHITIYVNRPTVSKELADIQEYSTLTSSQVDRMSAKDMQLWIQSNCKLKIRIHRQGGQKELNRIARGFEQMRLPEKESQDEQPARCELLKIYRQLMTCNDHTVYPQEPLWACVLPEELQCAKEFIYSRLRQHQADVVRAWENNGVWARTVALGGLSGSGKTTTLLHTLLPYLLYVEVTDEERKEMSIERREFRDAFARAAGENDKSKQDYLNIEDIGDHTQRLSIKNRVYQKGRVTLCACQNETVDALFLGFNEICESFANSTGRQPFLGIRCHSLKSELDAVMAMVRPDFGREQDTPPYLISNIVGNHKGRVNSDIYTKYKNASHNTRHHGIRDRRIINLECSMASYILQLANTPAFPRSEQLLAAYSPEDLVSVEAEMSPLLDAYRELRVNGNQLTEEISAGARKAAKTGYLSLLSTAHFVVCTLSTATSNGFNAIRQSTAVHQEEAGRCNGADSVGRYSMFTFAKLHSEDGDWRQLPPMMLGPKEDNAFYLQGQLSLFARLHATGFPVHELKVSARFQNDALLRICGIVNDMPEIRAIEGSFKNAETQRACAVMRELWGVFFPVVYLNITGSTPRITASGSTYNLEFAIVAMHSIVHRLQNNGDGSRITYLSPYKAQVGVVKTLMSAARTEALAAKQVVLAASLGNVELSTVDSYMGNDNDHVILDYAGHVGFITELPRHLVANTRARQSVEYLCDTIKFTEPSSEIPRSHPFFKVIEFVNQAKAIVRIDHRTRSRYTQYANIMEGLVPDVK